MKINSYKELIVWQKSIQLVSEIYKLTEKFPRAEVYGLTSQMRRCAVSIPSNIAEGWQRGTKKDYRHFLLISFGSSAELETQLIISKSLHYSQNTDIIDNLLLEVLKMLNAMIAKLS